MKKYSSIMKGNYRPTSPKRFKLAAWVVILVLITGWLFPRLISVASFVVLYPVHTVAQWYETSESVLPQYLRSRAALLEEKEELKKQLAVETGTELSIKRLQSENVQLRAAANFGTRSDRVVARVIAEPNRLFYDQLQIDKGTNDGIVVGAPVFVGIDSVVGVVVHTAPYYSFVELFTAPGFSGTAFIVGANIFAPLEGVGGGVARVRVPQGVSLSVGDLILLPSVESGVYGEIVSIDNMPTQPEQYGYITPPVPLRSMAYVSVILGEPPVRTSEVITEQLRTIIRDYFTLDTADFPADFTSTTTATSAVTETVDTAPETALESVLLPEIVPTLPLATTTP